MMHRHITWLMVATILAIAGRGFASDFSNLNSIEKTPDGWRTVGPDPWMHSAPLATPVPADARCLVIEARYSKPTHVQIYWMGLNEAPGEDRSARFPVAASEDYRTYAVNLGQNGTFRGVASYRLDPADGPGVTFDLRRVSFLPPTQVPAELLPSLLDFRCYTSKLHYQPGERIEYRATLAVECYPDRESSKILDITLLDIGGQRLASAVQQYGIRPASRFKEIQGVFDVSSPLAPGPYILEATSTDQRSGLKLTARHEFGVQGPADPFVCETPFKFVKDFSIIRGPGRRWHVFSITGDFFAGHAWSEDGQERSFSHASSENLRTWTMHPPVISVSDAAYPDGNGRYKDRNVWAPHVIAHDGQYWMFYTSVNQHVSQSISLATSKDLFEWTEHPGNPVFTLEGVEWAAWARDRWADCRDPMVFADDGRFYLYVTASVTPPGEKGAVVVAESDDLIHWRNPAIAVRAPIIAESPQVFKTGDAYCMTTSSHGANTYTSKHPVSGWQATPFPRPDIAAVEEYVGTSGSYAEEVVRLDDGSHLMASLTFRHYGNSIYLFRMLTKNGIPAGYESSFSPEAPSPSGKPVSIHPTATTQGHRIPVVYSTDLFHPHDDPDDHFDLATLFGLDEFDVRAILLDLGDRQRLKPGTIPLEQMFALTGRRVPFATGLSGRLKNPADKGLDQPPADQAAVDLLIRTLRESPTPVTVITAGSLRDVCAAFNRDPDLLRKKIARLYINIGDATDGSEWNVDLDAQAYIGILRSGLPVYWCPCRPFENERSTYWRFGQGQVLETAPEPLRNFFIYALHIVDPRDLDPTAALTGNLHAWRRPVYNMQRQMWCTASFLHAAGRPIRKTSDGYIATRDASVGGEPVEPFTFVPAGITVDDNARTRSTFDATEPNMHAFKMLDRANYEPAMTGCLRSLFQVFPVAIEDDPTR